MSLQTLTLSENFKEAFNYAFMLHKNQIRKGTNVPYLSHLMAVAVLVLENGGDEEEAIAALLHDAVEDQGGLQTLEEIKRRFGERVSTIVEGCTDSFSIPKPPWRERKLRYLRNLTHASGSILKVSLADKLHNIHSMTHAYQEYREQIWERFRGGKDGTLWYYHQLSRTFHRHGENAMLAEFDRILHQLETLIESEGRELSE
jgi:(p)ppGpp synthase/HD superfamily hydrolase